jgi:hypothetical protein
VNEKGLTVVTHSLTNIPSRRDVLRGLAGAALGLGAMRLPAEAKRRSRTVTRTYSADTTIFLPPADSHPASASVYPSPIRVKGLKGTIRDVNVRLNSISHSDPRDIEVLLVGPRGQAAVVMADIGGGEQIFDVTLRLDDEAETPLSATTPLQSGTFRPTNRNGGAVAFNAPAPSASANAALSVFDGSNPNGTWRLFIQDDAGAATYGGIKDGWSLEITTKVKAKKKKR